MNTPSNAPFILGFYGQSGIGKTHLLRQIVTILTAEDFRVAVVKISDKAISIDTEGKDTYLYGQAGARMVVFSSASETAFLVKEPLSTRTIIKTLSQQEPYDFIFIEGALEAWIPKIRLGELPLRENTLFTYDGDFENLFAQIRVKNIDMK